MEIDKNWAVDIDIIATCYIFCINIVIYKFDENKNYISFINSYIYKENTKNNPLLILIYENNNHYNLIYPKSLQIKNSTDKTYLDNLQNNIFLDVKKKN